MTERVIDVVPGLVRGHKRDGRCVYDRRAKQELVRRCQQPGAVAAPRVADGYVEIVLAAGVIRLHGRVSGETLGLALDGLLRRS